MQLLLLVRQMMVLPNASPAQQRCTYDHLLTLLLLLLLLSHDWLMCLCRHVLKMLGPRTKGSAALARAATLLQKRDDLSQLLASTLKLPPEHCELLAVDPVMLLVMSTDILILF